MSKTLVVDGNHLRRMMQLCRILSSGGGTTLAQLRGKLKASRRTVFRDLAALGDLGIKVDLGDKGYRIKQSSSVCRKMIADSHTKALNRLLSTCLK